MNESSSWGGVTIHPHRFGGIEFRLGKRELGHLHGNRLLDIPFPMKVRNELIAAGQADAHHVLPQSGWVSKRIHSPEDVERAIELLRLSFALATDARKKRALQTHSAEEQAT